MRAVYSERQIRKLLKKYITESETGIGKQSNKYYGLKKAQVNQDINRFQTGYRNDTEQRRYLVQ